MPTYSVKLDGNFNKLKQKSLVVGMAGEEWNVLGAWTTNSKSPWTAGRTHHYVFSDFKRT